MGQFLVPQPTSPKSLKIKVIKGLAPVLLLNGATKMTLPMRNLIQRNGVYAVRVQLPADVRVAFGKTAEVRSLKTRNLNDALEKAGPMVAEIKRQIERARRGEERSPQTPS